MAEREKDLYRILGVPRGATDKEIKSAYRKLAKRYHPDTNQGNKLAQQKFQEIGEAYNILSDSKKRGWYDKYGMAAFDGSMGPDPDAYAAEMERLRRSRSQEFGYNGFGTGASGFDQGGFDHSSFTKGGRHFTRRNPDGSYSEYYYSSDGNEDWINDLLKNMGASGFRNDASGNKRQWTFHSESPFTESGHQSTGRRTPHPDISEYKEIKPGFRRKGNDVYVTENIPYTTAVLGGKAYFKTLSGLVECSVPAGTQSGSRIRLKGKGLPASASSNVYGDEYVCIQIIVPQTLSPEERNAVLQLQKVQTLGRGA